MNKHFQFKKNSLANCTPNVCNCVSVLLILQVTFYVLYGESST